MNPGVYFMDRGTFRINGGATLQGTGVTIVFTSTTGTSWPTGTINGGATINLTAPTEGPTAGLLFFGDRNMPQGTSYNFAGGADQTLKGALYLPKAAIQFAGGTLTSTGCTKLIGDTVTFDGNSSIEINCTGSGVKPFGTAVASLVE